MSFTFTFSSSKGDIFKFSLREGCEKVLLRLQRSGTTLSPDLYSLSSADLQLLGKYAREMAEEVLPG